MAEPELVKKWVEKADEDFGYAVLSLKEGFSFFPQICWHFHQATEKYLKAYIIAHNLEFRKIHDLIALLKICENKDPAFHSLFENCTYLQRFYIETRYPVIWQVEYSKEHTMKAQDMAKSIIDFVRNHILL